MDFLSKLPELADDALTNLGDNAERLAQSGTPKQQHAAQELIPAIRAEQDARKAKKLEKTRRASTARKAKKSPAKTAAAEEKVTAA